MQNNTPCRIYAGVDCVVRRRGAVTETAETNHRTSVDDMVRKYLACTQKLTAQHAAQSSNAVKS